MPSGGGGPDHDAGLGLGQAPALGLFTSMVVPAEGSQVTLAGAAALVVGSGVVQVAAGGGPGAAGRRTGGGAGPDQVLEFAAGLVARLLVAMVAVAAGDRGDGQAQAAGGEVAQAVGAGDAAVAEGAAFVVGKGDTATAGRMVAREPGQPTGQRRVDGAEPGDRAGLVALAEGGGQREGQVDPGGQASLVRWRAGRDRRRGMARRRAAGSLVAAPAAGLLGMARAAGSAGTWRGVESRPRRASR